jgi:uncharacterized protein YodC (DUF2158 family)
MDIKIGDTVTLKKGGPFMNVEYIIGHDLPENCEVYYAPGIERGYVICTWLDEKDFIKGTVYSPEELEPVTILCSR